MTHFAGLLLKRDDVPKEQYFAELKSHLSRYPGERIEEFVSGALHVCHFDVSGTPETDRIETEERFTLVCGAPLVRPGPDRTADKRELDRRLAGGEERLLAARGVFCGITFDRTSREVRLFTDRLGIRPFYYYEDDRIVAFSSALRVLSACSFCPTEIDLLGIMEIVRFGGALGAGTAFARMRAARPAEVLRINRHGTASSFYWRWDDIEPRPEWPRTGAADLHELFRDAVALRRGSGKQEYAFLSGGMDSRAIVATLQALGAEPHTYCFLPGSVLDGDLAAQYAAAAGIDHVSRPHHRIVIPELQSLMAGELRERLGRDASLPAVWSGDGGSVGLGHVYFEQTAIDALRADRIDEAIRRFLPGLKFGIPRGIFTEEAYQRVQTALLDAIRGEVASYNPLSRERWLFCFLLCNEQRPHLRAYIEALDLVRMELVLPFFDWEFLTYICTLPIEECLWHKAYSRFFDLLPASARSVPWQTYPGHVPCPLPLPKGARTQWERGAHWRGKLARKVSSLRALRYALSPQFPASLLDRGGTSVRALADLSWISDRGFEIQPVALCAEMARPGRAVVMADDE